MTGTFYVAILDLILESSLIGSNRSSTGFMMTLSVNPALPSPRRRLAVERRRLESPRLTPRLP